MGVIIGLLAASTGLVTSVLTHHVYNRRNNYTTVVPSLAQLQQPAPVAVMTVAPAQLSRSLSAVDVSVVRPAPNLAAAPAQLSRSLSAVDVSMARPAPNLAAAPPAALQQYNAERTRKRRASIEAGRGTIKIEIEETVTEIVTLPEHQQDMPGSSTNHQEQLQLQIDNSPQGNGMSVEFAKPLFDGNYYQNPESFSSWKEPPSAAKPNTWSDLLWWKLGSNRPTIPNEKLLNVTLPVFEPDFQTDFPLSATWLGHATLFVRIDGISVLTDPVWAMHANPSFLPFFNCPRYRPPPCKIEQLPTIDIVLISHNHYDHLDIDAVRQLARQFPRICWIVPMGLKQWMEKETNSQSVHELNWGQCVQFDCDGGRGTFDVCSVPAQHWSQRTMFDRNMSLWSGWLIKGPKRKFFYAGDTGFCAEEFKKLGVMHGPIDLSAIPIGAYEPRCFMAPLHIDPSEAVKIHRLIKSKKSIGLHWGTFAMGSEGYLEPQTKLAKSVKAEGLGAKEFVTLQHGQSWREGSNDDGTYY